MTVATSDAWCFAFLDSIRNRGVTSMALAIPRLRRERHLSRSEATAMLARWAEHYGMAHDETPLFGREVRLPRPWGERAADASKALGRIASYIARAAPELAAALKSTVFRHSWRPL